jgi:hypothetical protein
MLTGKSKKGATQEQLAAKKPRPSAQILRLLLLTWLLAPVSTSLLKPV